MALQKQPIPIVFAEGIDTKTDEKLVLPTKLLQLENGVFTKRGRINKRNGYDILSRRILGSENSIDSASGVSTFKNELNLFTGTKLYSYVEASASWAEKGTNSSVTIRNKSVIRNIYQQTDPDYAYNNGLGCYVWKDSVGGSRFTVVDEVNGVIVSENQSMSSTGISPRVVGIGRYFFIFYIESTTIKFRTIQLSTPNTISSAQDISTTVDGTDKIYDVQKVGDRAYIAYNDNDASGAIKVLYITATKVLSSEIDYVAEQAKAISICSDSSNNIWVSYADGTNVKYLIRDYSLDSAVLAPTVVEALATVRNIASVQTADETVTLLYEKTNSPTNYVKKTTVSLGGTVGTPAVFVRSVGLGSKFFEYNDQYHIALTHTSTLQSTYFIYTLGGDIVTKCQNGVGGGLTAASVLPSVVEIDTGKFVFPSLQKGILQTEAGVVFTSLGVSSTLIDFDSLNNFVTAELGNQLHIVGGILQSYDGASVVETGFNVYPEGTTTSVLNAGTGHLANGTHNYAIVYAWIDNQGQIHRSAEEFVSRVISGGPSDIRLVIPTLRITKKQNVFIEIYRTENNGTIYYKLTSNTSLTANNPAVDTITYDDTTVTDATLVSGELLYTTGGELENIAPPSSSVITTWKNRVALKSSDEENTVWYSKIRQEGKPVEFSDLLKIVVDAKGGDITALGVLDEKLIIFKNRRIFMQAGDGPNNFGTQSDFGLPAEINAGDVGCTDVNSVVPTPVGLMFKSEKGIYLLNRGLAVSYIGAAVEAYNELRITAAQLVPDANQVRFTTEDGLCLVYDYMFEQWSTFTNHEAVGANTYSNQFCFAKSDGQVFKENPSIFTDGAQAVKLKLVSSWIQLSNVQGLQRIYKLFLLGEYKSAHRLKVQIGYDFEPFFTQEVTIDVDGVLDPTTYGSSSPYGAELVYGGEFPRYQWKLFPKRQKCQAIRISIEDIMDDTFGESFNISSLRIEAGMKQGSAKLPAGRAAGTE